MSSSEELWEESESTKNIVLVQVTPVRPDNERDKKDAPQLRNIYGLINMLTRPTAKKSGGVVECIDESTKNNKIIRDITEIMSSEEK